MLNIRKLDNGNNEIIVPKDIRYISDWKDYDLSNFNFPHILDKKITGCGFTEYCITCNIPIILCSPRKILLENKEEQHQDSVLYFKNELDEDSAVDKDISKSTKAEISKEELDLIRRQQILDGLENSVNEYVRMCLFKGMAPKILVTYDSFRLVKQFLGDKINRFHVVIDEFQSIFVDSRFKSDTEISFVSQVQGLQNICYVSATPMMDEYLKQLDEFKDLPYYEFNWVEECPLRIIKPDIKATSIKSVQSAAEKIINSYKNGQFEKSYTSSGEIIESKEAVIYVNSVSNIISIISKCNLKPDECNILCANNRQNSTRIKRRLGKDFEIGKVPTRGEPHKMFTLCTRTVYLGADFYSTNARTFILSDANIDSLSVDITLDLPQILGRQRLSENPWKNRAELYYKTLRAGGKIDQEEFEKFIQDKLKRTENLLLSYKNSPTDDAKHDLAKKYLNDVRFSNYKEDYVAVNINSGSDLIPTLNKLVLVSERMAFKTQQVDYSSRVAVYNKMSDTGFVDNSIIDNFMKVFNGCSLFRDRMKLLCECELPDSARSFILDQLKLQYRNFYEGLGPERCKALGYDVTRMSRELSNKLVDSSEIESRIYEEILVGEKYTKSELKNKLADIYSDLSYNKTPKATDLDEYFVLKECLIQNKETGKRDRGFEILKRR